MLVLITGATGLVGKEVMNYCRIMDIDVHFLTTSKSKLDSHFPAKGFYWNPKKGKIDINAFKGVTHIIHLAGASVAKRWTCLYKREILKSRTKSANWLYKTLKQIDHTVSSFVSASAIGIYSNSATEYYSEGSTHLSDKFLGKVVKSWESAADQFSDLKIKVTKFRTGIVLSDREGALPKLLAPIKMYAGTSFGDGEQWQSWIHVSDLAKMFLFAAENKLEGVYNACAPNPVTQSKLIKNCADILNKPLWMPHIPAIVTRIIFGEMSQLLLSSQRVSSNKIRKVGFGFEYPSIEAAIKEILQESEVLALQ